MIFHLKKTEELGDLVKDVVDHDRLCRKVGGLKGDQSCKIHPS